jgi:hypothetical protein
MNTGVDLPAGMAGIGTNEQQLADEQLEQDDAHHNDDNANNNPNINSISINLNAMVEYDGGPDELYFAPTYGEQQDDDEYDDVDQYYDDDEDDDEDEAQDDDEDEDEAEDDEEQYEEQFEDSDDELDFGHESDDDDMATRPLHAALACSASWYVSLLVTSLPQLQYLDGAYISSVCTTMC